MADKDRVRVLLVDDQPAKLVTLQAILADLDEEIVEADCADDALKILLSSDVAIILVDVCMPGMDGFELAELIRGHPRFNRTAIIFISAVHLTDADRVKAYGLGAVDYIPVPIVPELLRAKVQVFADLRRKSDQLERVNAELQRRLAELHHSNERLRLADRMATIGMLAAGLGHDMGNILLPVRMRLESLEKSPWATHASDDLTAIRRATEYLQRLAASLRLLSLDPETTPRTGSTDLGAWWEETQGIFRSAVSRSIELVGDVPRTLAPVRMDKAGLTQAVFNLIQNADDALKRSAAGRITVSASPSALPDSIRVCVIDDGPGMDENERRRCLEPFFTTKTREVSTGLGLALVAGLVKRAGGTLSVESEPGRGAKFTLDLPAAHPDGHGAEPPRHGCASIVLKDVRLVAHVRRVLTELRYDVLNGHPGKADLLITEDDGPGAIEAALRFTRSGPDARVLMFAEHEQPGGEERIVRVPRSTPPSRLRSCISAALGRSDTGSGEPA